MDLDISYCRLCAESKPCNKQCNLQLDDVKKYELIEKLKRINAVSDFDRVSLPKTVCFDCIHALNRAYDFVLAVECAQTALSELFEVKNVKKEEVVSEAEQSDPDFLDEAIQPDVDLKKESDDSEFGSSSESDTRGKKSKYKRKKVDVDAIPLSQLSQLKLTWSSYSWYCTFCETQFSTIDELRNHSIELHNMCNPYRCTDCKTRKIRLDSFLLHVQRHHKYLRYSCYKCFQQFDTAVETRKHKSTHLTTKYICIGCNTPFPSNNDLKNHVDEYCQSRRARRIPISLQSDGLTCKICQKSFKTKSSLNTHVMIHTERKKDHMCEICGKGFFIKYNLATHMVMHKDDRPHKCQICNYAFKTARLLKNHVGVHNNDKPFSCNQCGRRFRLQKQLQSHHIIHTDVHPHVCPYCNKRFRFKTILNNHVRLHTGVKPYSCETCQRDFTNWSNYNKHMKRKHNMDTSKKKHTPDGVYPIDPSTGMVIIREETNQMIEWKKNMLVQRRLGRPPKTTLENIEQSKNTLLQL